MYPLSAQAQSAGHVPPQQLFYNHIQFNALAKAFGLFCFFLQNKRPVWHHLVVMLKTQPKLSLPSVLWNLANNFDVGGGRRWLVRACVCLCQDLKPVDVTNKRSLWENKGTSPTKVRTTSPPSPFSIHRAALRNSLPPPKWSIDHFKLLCGLEVVSSLSFFCISIICHLKVHIFLQVDPLEY